MPFYTALGAIPRKRHIVFRRPDGGLYSEELMGHEGFVGTASLLYHIHPPTTVKSARRLRRLVRSGSTTACGSDPAMAAFSCGTPFR